ncbi:c-type cytochrome domain-containing protein [Ferruginibacter paludis]|uniref:DUF2231 domain-containing protein n=1 Tax=Ferruginibacter paludis TaxID=1310417 RepID=UPI0025B3F077|nr:DUF2231 domain-containing protein [Ferruginibacter paludis]MDN3655624.1 c-type cytochrome domain-containing protein [Ferruginibacter paludis]
MILLDITTFMGRLHPMVVHLPIGFLLLAVVFELMSYSNRFKYLKTAVSITLLFGFITATAACVLGYLLSLSGDYEYVQLNRHKLTGIAVAILSGLLFLLTTKKISSRLPIPEKILSVVFVGLFFLMTYTGHQGGNLTHGSDYLSMNVLQGGERKKPVSVEEALLFEDVVQPLLIKRCGQCHASGKLKGQLSVQSLAALLKGGKSRAAVVGGNLQGSELYQRITMDPSNEKFMPADGKTPFTKQEVALIKWWIEKGNAAAGVKMAGLKDAEAIKPNVAALLGLGDAGEVAESNGPQVNPDIPKTVDQGQLDSLRSKGMQVRIMSHNPVMLDVTLPAGATQPLSNMKSNLKAVAKNIVWLNLSHNNCTDASLDFLPLMTNLEKLRLEKNPLTDGIVNQLSGLQHLEALNLNETGVTAAGLEKLKSMSSLKRVYNWNGGGK